MPLSEASTEMLTLLGIDPRCRLVESPDRPSTSSANSWVRDDSAESIVIRV